MHQAGKVDESLSCDKGEQTDVLVTIDDVLNNEDTGLHVPEDPLSGPGSAHNDILINTMAPSANGEMFATESFLIEVYKLDNTHIPVISIIDNSALHESLHCTHVIQDRRLYIDICSMRDTLSRNEISKVKLTSSQDQLTDCSYQRYSFNRTSGAGYGRGSGSP